MRDFEPADPSLLDRRWHPLKVRTSRRIEASPEAVWATVSDPLTWSSWHEDYSQHTVIGDQSEGIGARFQTIEMGLKSESAMIRWEPGRLLGLSLERAAAWRWLLRTHYTEIEVEAVPGSPDAATVHYRVAFTGTILFWLLCAYTIGYSLVSIYWDATSSLKSLDKMLVTEG